MKNGGIKGGKDGRKKRMEANGRILREYHGIGHNAAHVVVPWVAVLVDDRGRWHICHHISRQNRVPVQNSHFQTLSRDVCQVLFLGPFAREVSLREVLWIWVSSIVDLLILTFGKPHFSGCRSRNVLRSVNVAIGNTNKNVRQDWRMEGRNVR